MRHRDITMAAASAAAVTAIMVGAAGTAAAEPDRISQPPTAALASCNGESCRGKLAGDQGCNADAYQVAGFQVDGETAGQAPYPDVNLLYSPTCDAAWGHYWSNNAHESRTVFIEWLYPYGAAPLPDDRIAYLTSGPTEYWTTMVPWGFSIRICARPGSNNFTDKCSGWR